MATVAQPAAIPPDPAMSFPRKDIIYFSQPQPVSMGILWFEAVSLEHFWMIRRYEVLRRLAGVLDPKLNYCEIGCGIGLLQLQLEEEAGLTVDGFDLCEPALQRNQSRRGKLYFYNVFERRPELKEAYDTVFLCDVLEHVEQDRAFFETCLLHVRPGGVILINVPAREELRSKYDRLVGHVRRYTLSGLQALVESAGAEVSAGSYWGLPFYPILLVRKILMRKVSGREALRTGMHPPNRAANWLLHLWSQLEFIPQRTLGTSIMLRAIKR